MVELSERLRVRGWRLTAQRRAIADVFRGQHVHLTADEVVTAAREALPEVSTATVYNTLNELVAMGELKEILLGAGRKHYDPNIEIDHQHLVCDNCGAVLDIVLDKPPALSKRQRAGYTLNGVAVTFHGHCPDCAD